MPRTPGWKHQDDEFEEHSDAPFRAKLWQMRTGKSKSTLDDMCKAASAGRVDAGLAFAPNGPHGQWGRRDRHLVHWWPEVPVTPHVWRSSAEHGRREVKATHDASLEACLNERHGFPLLVVNTEALILPRAQAAIKRLMRRRRVFTVFDEVQDFRSPGSHRSRVGRGVIRKHSEMIRILTGTPVANTPLAAWAEFELLSKGALGYERFGDFKESFALYEQAHGQGGSMYPRLKSFVNLDRLQALIGAWSSVVLRRDCLDLPPLVPCPRSVTMSEAAEALYARISKEAELEFEGGRLSRIEAGKRYIKLQQCLSGYVVDDRGDIRAVDEPCDCPRIQACVEEVRGTDGKVIVWALFREEIRRLATALSEAGIPIVQYHGGVGDRDRDRNVDLFMDPSSGVKCLLGQPAAGGVGLDLGIAEAIVNYSHTRNAIVRQQSIERATVMGGRSVALVDFECPGTVDTVALADHANKDERADEVAGSGLQDWMRMMA